MKWNGAHDEEFFRCIEQYLDEAIKKFVREKDFKRMKAVPLAYSPMLNSPDEEELENKEPKTTGKILEVSKFEYNVQTVDESPLPNISNY